MRSSGRGLVEGVDLAVGAVRTGFSAGLPLQGHRDPLGPREVVCTVATVPFRLLPLLLGTASLALHGLLAHRGERLRLWPENQILQTAEADTLLARLVSDQEHGLQKHLDVVVDLSLAHGLADLDQIVAQFFGRDLPEPQVRTPGRRCRLLSLLVLGHTLNVGHSRISTSEYKSNRCTYLD